MNLLGGIIGHLVGDYLLQNDWMALQKKQSSFRCAVHCAIWTAAVCFFGRVGQFTVNLWLVVAILFVTHFIQDRTQIIARYMDAIGQKQFRTGPCAPWSIIVVDNVWHIVTIWAVWRFV